MIVSGKPATGKTTLARRLAADLALPLFAKDGVKETLFDAMGVGDRAWSRRLGAGSMATLYHITATLLAARVSLMVEANFRPAMHAPLYGALAERTGARVAQVWLTASPDTLLRRFEARAATGGRHAGHVEQANMAEFRALLVAEDAALPLPGAIFTVDTTDFAAVRYAELLAALRLARDGAVETDRSS
ncbi:MAG: AAA family ATPase [Chloroflexota bacterium]|nr:AAA family ATPase [Chloroflexota bacterium]